MTGATPTTPAAIHAVPESTDEEKACALNILEVAVNRAWSVTSMYYHDREECFKVGLKRMVKLNFGGKRKRQTFETVIGNGATLAQAITDAAAQAMEDES